MKRNENAIEPTCRLKEDSFLLKDPFSASSTTPIILGSPCTICRFTVCVGQVNSIDKHILICDIKLAHNSISRDIENSVKPL